MLADRKRRIEFFEKTLAQEHIDELTELEFSQIISILWSSQILNKSYVVERILKTIDFAALSKELEALLWGEGPIEKRKRT